MDVVSWLLAKKYTDNSLIGIGALKGAPCKVKSVEKADGQTTVTLTWKDDNGVSHDTDFYVKDGVTKWASRTQYAVGDLVINDDILYYCDVANNDATFDPAKWTAVSGAADIDYYIVQYLTDLPSSLSSSDHKIYFVLEDKSFHLWDGTSWSVITSDVKVRELTQAEYDALTPAEQRNGTIYFVTDAGGSGGDAELEHDVTANITVGAITSGTKIPRGTTFTQFVEKLLIAEIAPTIGFSLSKSGNVPSGSSYTETLTVNVSAMGTAKSIDTIAWYEGNTLLQTDTISSTTTGSWTYTMATATTTDTTFKAVVTYKKSDDAQTNVTKTASITFLSNKYRGIVASLTPSEADVEALTSEIASSKAGTYAFTANAARIAYAYPKHLGALTSIKDGNGFSLIDSFTRTTETYTQNGEAVDYYLYVLTDPTTVTNYTVVFA